MTFICKHMKSGSGWLGWTTIENGLLRKWTIRENRLGLITRGKLLPVLQALFIVCNINSESYECVNNIC